VLFDPSQGDSGETVSIPELVYRSISRCDPEMRKELMENIYISGGVTNTANLLERLQKEISAKFPFGSKVRLHYMHLSTHLEGTVFNPAQASMLHVRLSQEYYIQSSWL
jgi:hypothetical protein